MNIAESKNSFKYILFPTDNNIIKSFCKNKNLKFNDDWFSILEFKKNENNIEDIWYTIINNKYEIVINKENK